MSGFAKFRLMLIAVLVAIMAGLFAASSAQASVTNQYYISLATGAHPTAIAFSGDGNYVFVTESSTKQVVKIDVATKAIVSHVTFASEPRGIAVSPDSSTLWVTVNGTYPTVPANGGVVGIRASDMTVSQPLIPLPYHAGTVDYSGFPSAIILNSSGTKAYVLGGGSGELYEVDLVAHTLTQHVQLVSDDSTQNDILDYLAINPDNSKVFVTSHVETSSLPAENQVFSVPTANFSANSVVSPGSYNFVQPNGVAVSPDGRFLYITDPADYSTNPTNGDNYVYVLDAHTEQFITRFIANSTQVSPSNNFVAVSSDSSQYVVMDSQNYGMLQFFDTATNNSLFSYSLGDNSPSTYTANPKMFVINKAGTMIAIALTQDDGVALIDLNPPLLAQAQSSLANTGNSTATLLSLGVLIVLAGIVLTYRSQKTKRPLEINL